VPFNIEDTSMLVFSMEMHECITNYNKAVSPGSLDARTAEPPIASHYKRLFDLHSPQRWIRTG
jgi:hypothetical protein